MVRFPELVYHVRVVRDERVGAAMAAAVAPAVVGVVAARSYDPVVPAELLETDVEALLAALVAQVEGAVEGAPTHLEREHAE